MTPFYEHLNGCSECRSRPFELCAEGLSLAKRAALTQIDQEKARRLAVYRTLCKELGVEPLL